MVYTERAEMAESFMWHQPCQRCKYTTSVDIQKRAMSKLFTHVKSHASAVSLLESGEQRYIKAIISSFQKSHACILLTSCYRWFRSFLYL